MSAFSCASPKPRHQSAGTAASTCSVPGGGVAAVAGDAIDALGFDLMRAAVPGVLHRYLEWAPSAVRRCDAALARFAVAAAAREGTA